MLPSEGGKHFSQEKQQNIGRKGCVKHDRHRESNELRTKFKRLQVLCIRSFLQTRLGDENSTGIKPQAVFEGGKERTHSEPNEQQSNKSEQNLQKIIFLKPLGGQKLVCLIEKARSRFFKNMLPTAGKRYFLENM